MGSARQKQSFERITRCWPLHAINNSNPDLTCSKSSDVIRDDVVETDPNKEFGPSSASFLPLGSQNLGPDAFLLERFGLERDTLLIRLNGLLLQLLQHVTARNWQNFDQTCFK